MALWGSSSSVAPIARHESLDKYTVRNCCSHFSLVYYDSAFLGLTLLLYCEKVMSGLRLQA